MAAMIFADAASRFQWIPHFVTDVSRRLLSATFVTASSAVWAAADAVETEGHPLSFGAGLLAIFAVALNAWNMYKSNREADLRRQLDDMRRSADADRKESMDNQAAMRVSLHSIRDHLQASHLENEVLRRDGDADREANRRLTAQLREANVMVDSLRVELHEANEKLASISTGLDHLNRGLDDDRAAKG